MDPKPIPRPLYLDVSIAAYLGDWIDVYEKSIQTLANQKALTCSKVKDNKEKPKSSSNQ